MKVVILAGGFGTRLSEETDLKPKPMVEIGGKPILWHIMKHYAHYGHTEFIILLGYKGYIIKEFFANYFLHNNDVTFDLQNNSMQIHNSRSENWKVSLIDTGLNTMTGGRIKRIKEFVGNEPFFLTYGDGVSNVDLDALTRFHREHKKKCTMTAVQQEGRFGVLKINESTDSISHFFEKPQNDGAWINGGFFLCEPSVIDYIKSDNTVFEREPLEKMAEASELVAFKHFDFWKCMDTLRDKNQLNEMWENDKAAWKIW